MIFFVLLIFHVCVVLYIKLTVVSPPHESRIPLFTDSSDGGSVNALLSLLSPSVITIRISLSRVNEEEETVRVNT